MTLGTESYRWKSNSSYYCSCEDYCYNYEDNKSNNRILLETISKCVKTKKALSIINNTSTCYLEHIPQYLQSGRQLSKIACSE